jgi:hypothetical protein
VCGCLDLSLLSNQPNLYFVLDRSGSMATSSKWTTIRTVVANTMSRIGPRAYFGAAVFPDPRSDNCAPGIEVMSPRLGDTPGSNDTSAFFTLATNLAASGGTPTAATLTALLDPLSKLTAKTFVILATDGGPNCNTSAACGVDACIPNIEQQPGCTATTNCCASQPTQCLDANPTVQAIANLAAQGILTYVIGVPGSAPYAAVLDSMAQAGGTARASEPLYYAVDSTDQDAFTAALSSIAAQITATCTLLLDQTPPDPSHVNVYLDGVVVPQDPANGWTLSGTTITLEGATCQRVLLGDALSLRVVAGCPTVLK